MIKLKQLPKLYKQIIQEEFNLLLALLYFQKLILVRLSKLNHNLLKDLHFNHFLKN